MIIKLQMSNPSLSQYIQGDRVVVFSEVMVERKGEEKRKDAKSWTVKLEG